MPDPADCQMHANAALCRVRSLAGQGGEMQSITWEHTLHVHTRIKEESYIVRSHRSEASTGHELEFFVRNHRLLLSSSPGSSCKSRIQMCTYVLNWNLQSLGERKKSRDDQQASPAAQ